MTSDELVSVLEDLLEDMAVSDLRQGIDYKPAQDLSDRSWAILVRFIGGERPTWEMKIPDGSQVLTREMIQPPAPPRQLDPVRDPDEPLKLGGEFSGVSLP